MLTTMNDAVLKLVAQNKEQSRTIQAQNTTIEGLRETVEGICQNDDTIWALKEEMGGLMRGLKEAVTAVQAAQNRSVSSTSLSSGDWPLLSSESTGPS
jgi:hypothetical protein